MTIEYYAEVAEQADARDLKSLGGNTIRVRFPSPAPTEKDTVFRVLFSWCGLIESNPSFVNVRRRRIFLPRLYEAETANSRPRHQKMSIVSMILLIFYFPIFRFSDKKSVRKTFALTSLI